MSCSQAMLRWSSRCWIDQLERRWQELLRSAVVKKAKLSSYRSIYVLIEELRHPEGHSEQSLPINRSQLSWFRRLVRMPTR